MDNSGSIVESSPDNHLKEIVLNSEDEDIGSSESSEDFEFDPKEFEQLIALLEAPRAEGSKAYASDVAATIEDAVRKAPAHKSLS